MENHELLEALKTIEEARDEILESLEKAERALRRLGGMPYARAQSYWIAHIETAVKKDHGYIGGSMITMDDTLEELRAKVEPLGCGDTCPRTRKPAPCDEDDCDFCHAEGE
jgi:hypothetical protein